MLNGVTNNMVEQGIQCDVTDSVITDDSQVLRITVNKIAHNRSNSEQRVGYVTVSREHITEQLDEITTATKDTEMIPRLVVTEEMTPIYVRIPNGAITSGVDMDLETVEWLETIAKEANK